MWVWKKVFVAITLALFLLPALSYGVHGGALMELNLGHDFASKSGSTKVTITLSGEMDYFSVSGTWSGSSPRWAAAALLTGTFDETHYKFVTFSSDRGYRVQDGTGGYNGYDFQWTWDDGPTIKPDHYGFDKVYYHQGYAVRYWDFWGARHDSWKTGTLKAESLVNEDYL